MISSVLSLIQVELACTPRVHCSEGGWEQCLLPTCRNLGALAVGSALEGRGSAQSNLEGHGKTSRQRQAPACL